jgi:hypothetical protein
MSNLDRPRPEEWVRGSLFSFIEECWNNSVAVVANKNVTAHQLTAIDAIFEEVHKNLKPSAVIQLVPSLLLLRSFSAFRASVMVCLCLPTDSYPLQRACLENAGYARLISTSPELSKQWLNRDADPEAKNRFSNRAIREAIAAEDAALARIYQELYERTIDFGAHPNEKSVVSNIIEGSVETGTLQFRMLAGDDMSLKLGLRTCAQVGICSLKILNLIFSEQFAPLRFKRKIDRASMSY